ncbi:hypothetical protein ABMA09_23450 [Erwinia rhapontici]|nr:hypothetical protein EDF84_102562 [Erwinia rhapontici]
MHMIQTIVSMIVTYGECPAIFYLLAITVWSCTASFTVTARYFPGCMQDTNHGFFRNIDDDEREPGNNQLTLVCCFTGFNACQRVFPEDADILTNLSSVALATGRPAS